MRNCTETSERNYRYWLRNNSEQRSSKNGLYNTTSRVELKCYGKRWSTWGEVTGKLANGVGSHASSEHGVSSITTADAHTSATSSRLNWRPCRFKWTLCFAGGRNLISARVPSHFKRSLQSTRGFILCKLHESSKLLNLRPALYILMQKAVILNRSRIIRKFLAEQWKRSAWSLRPVLF